MSFNIAEHPFYKGIKLFEDSQFKESFPLFLQEARQGNLYALYYLEYLQTKIKDDIKEIKEADEFLRSLPEYLENMPERIDKARVYYPKAWLQASLEIIEFKESKKSKISSFLKQLALDAPNAAVFWYEQAELIKPTAAMDKMPPHISTLLKTTDILALHTIFNMPTKHQAFISNAETVDKEVTGLSRELAYIKTCLRLLTLSKAGGAENVLLMRETGGDREYFLGCYHMKKIIEVPAEKDNFSVQRANGWHVKSAYLGHEGMPAEYVKRQSIPRDAIKWQHVITRKNSFNSLVASMETFFNGGNGIKKDLSKAKEYAEKVIAHPASREESHRVQLGAAYYIQAYLIHEGKEGYKQDINKAMSLYEQARNLVPVFPLLHLNLGNAYLDVEPCKKALDCFQTYISLEKSDNDMIAYAQMKIGEIYYTGGEGIAENKSEAMRYYLLASDKKPEAKARYWYYTCFDMQTGALK